MKMTSALFVIVLNAASPCWLQCSSNNVYSLFLWTASINVKLMEFFSFAELSSSMQKRQCIVNWYKTAAVCIHMFTKKRCSHTLSKYMNTNNGSRSHYSLRIYQIIWYTYRVSFWFKNSKIVRKFRSTVC